MARFTAAALSALAFIVAFAANSVAARAQVLCQTEADDITALATFDRAVTSYLEIHRRVDAAFMSIPFPSDPEGNAVASSRLADAIRIERRDAARGDIFNPEVADFFRVRLLIAARHGGVLPLSDGHGDREEGAGQCAPLPEVNSRVTWGTGIRVDEVLGHVLPSLPLELEYRLAGRALVLVDVSANLVIDVLVDAVP